MNTLWPRVRLGDVLRFTPRRVIIESARTYREIGIRSHARGIFHKPPVTGLDIGSKKVFYIEPGDFVLNIVFAWEGAVSVTSDAEAGMIASHRFPTFRSDPTRLDVKYLQYWCQTELGRSLLDRVSPGGAGRNRTLNRAAFLNQDIPLPPLAEQRGVVARIEEVSAHVREARGLRRQANGDVDILVAAAENSIWSDSSRLPSRRLQEVTCLLARGRQSEQGESDHYLIKTQHVQLGRYLPTTLRLAEHIAARVRDEALVRPGDLLIACSAAGCLGRVARYAESGKKISTGHARGDCATCGMFQSRFPLVKNRAASLSIWSPCRREPIG